MLVTRLVSLISNEFTVKDSFSFASEISTLRNRNYCMASFDIKSLFTNIPIDETNDIILSQLYPQPNTLFENIPRPILKLNC